MVGDVGELNGKVCVEENGVFDVGDGLEAEGEGGAMAGPVSEDAFCTCMWRRWVLQVEGTRGIQGYTVAFVRTMSVPATTCRADALRAANMHSDLAEVNLFSPSVLQADHMHLLVECHGYLRHDLAPRPCANLNWLHKEVATGPYSCMAPQAFHTYLTVQDN